ncbi:MULTISPECIES: phosphatase PAP2 family protein [Flavobacteriaceae]|uniref:phosphatase PAP2 family protein n=1 Tax=Flavobacteriaceae TaxID=49546 RepID=UPI0010AE22B4|nr:MULTISPECIES: phosphatase PAP2 family protein [Flavobacteriaceae]NJB36013.1 phosphatase PAP2 family protein [Croceivirga sp. JEA036]TKD59236.1 phosphatase PAP2 family protein [Flavobacterium sp. ASW18X]
MLEKLLEWDRDVFVYLNGLGVDRYDGFWSAITDIKTWTPLFIFFFILMFLKYDKKEAFLKTITVLLLVLFITTVTDLTKETVARLRPNNDEAINTIIRILRKPSDYSFFSGHASSSFSITTLVFLFLRKFYNWTILFYIWPILFCFSRIFVGVHFPIDILVGALVGTFSAWLFYRVHNILLNAAQRKAVSNG